MTFCAGHFTCSIFGTTTAVTTDVAAAAAVVVVITLRHRYNAGRGHMTGSHSFVLSPLFNMHGIL